jgi:HD superfamily phosphohydrolase
MEFRGMEAGVVDLANAAEVQRLRRIKQLGLNNLVFPAAEHSRFSHSLGAAHLAIRFSKQVADATQQVLGGTSQVGAEDIRAIAIAALCHDLGHGPLSHMWEREVIGRWFDRESWMRALGLEGEPGLDHLDWHELATQGLLAWPEGEIFQRLERYEEGLVERVRAILAGRYLLPYLPTLLGADIDVDRCDFVARDALHCGVEHGDFKLDWLISTITIGFDHDRPVIGFDRSKALRVVEQFLIARRALYDTVYQHRTVRSAEGMFGLLLKRLRFLVEEGQAPRLSNRGIARPFLRLFEVGVIGPPDLIRLDDDVLWLLVHDIAAQDRGDMIVRDLARRLLSRNLFKQVPITPDEVKDLNKHGSTRLADLEEVLGKALCCEDPKYYFHIDSHKLNLLEQGAGNGDAYDRCARFIHVDADGRPAELVRDTELVSYGKKTEEERLFVPEVALRPVKEFFGVT